MYVIKTSQTLFFDESRPRYIILLHIKTCIICYKPTKEQTQICRATTILHVLQVYSTRSVARQSVKHNHISIRSTNSYQIRTAHVRYQVIVCTIVRYAAAERTTYSHFAGNVIKQTLNEKRIRLLHGLLFFCIKYSISGGFLDTRRSLCTCTVRIGSVLTLVLACRPIDSQSNDARTASALFE